MTSEPTSKYQTSDAILDLSYVMSRMSGEE